MLVKLPSQDDTFVTGLKDFLHMNSASKAYAHCAQSHIPLVRKVASLELQNALLTEAVSDLKQVIKSMDSLARQVIEVTGQKDLFTDVR